MLNKINSEICVNAGNKGQHTVTYLQVYQERSGHDKWQKLSMVYAKYRRHGGENTGPGIRFFFFNILNPVICQPYYHGQDSVFLPGTLIPASVVWE